jgi:hypothetical protein
MRIRSAYPCDQKQLTTFGEIGFRRLTVCFIALTFPGHVQRREE